MFLSSRPEAGKRLVIFPVSGTAVRPEVPLNTPAVAAPAGASSQESSIPERPAETNNQEVPGDPTTATPKPTSSSSSGPSSTVTAPPPSSSSSVGSSVLSSTADSEQRSQGDVTGTATSTPASTSEPALSGRTCTPAVTGAEVHNLLLCTARFPQLNNSLFDLACVFVEPLHSSSSVTSLSFPPASCHPSPPLFASLRALLSFLLLCVHSPSLPLPLCQSTALIACP